MKLVLVRHAKAIDRIKALLKGINDQDRYLTKKGRQKFSEYVKENKKSFLKFDQYASSEYLRAEQSLDVMLEALYASDAVKFHRTKIKKITPDDLPPYFIKWVHNQKINSALIISHEPFMSKFLKSVLGNKWKDEKIKKGTAVFLDYSNGRFKLERVLHPSKTSDS